MFEWRGGGRTIQEVRKKECFAHAMVLLCILKLKMRSITIMSMLAII